MIRIFRHLILLLLFAPIYASSHEISQSDLSMVRSEPALLLTPAELHWLEQKPSLTYVYDPDWPPFEWTNEIQEHTGIIADIISIISKKTGIRFIPTRTKTWAEAVKLAESHKVDMYSAVAVTDEREKYLSFTSKSIYSYFAFFVSDINNNEDTYDVNHNLQGKVIALIKGNQLSQLVEKQNPESSFVYVDSAEQGFNMVRHKKADLYAENAATGTYLLNNKGYSDLKVYKKIDVVIDLKIALQKNTPPEALSILDKALSSIDKDELSHIFNKWTSVRIKKESHWLIIIVIVSLTTIIAIFVALINRKLKRFAYTDNLTGLPNRRLLTDRIKQAIHHSKRSGKFFAVCFIDLDGFKAVNDTYGHQAGDSILVEVAERLKVTSRSVDTLARLGGDEFVLVFVDINDIDELKKLLDRTLNTISASYKITKGNTEKEMNFISASIGITLCPQDSKEVDLLLRNADNAMYFAKQCGKNCYKFFGEL